MRMKNMVLAFILVFVLLLLAGCSKNSTESIDDAENRLKFIERHMDYSIAYDTQTGVCYLFGNHCDTVMVDKEGKPLIYEGFEK